ncbi:MAG TPA: pitrilysin family protein [Candidatus Eremiobacteraceae bacterium]|nr:pitrilysin family protein [Candidatus Eremiobacteraceae bacterium]
MSLRNAAAIGGLCALVFTASIPARAAETAVATRATLSNGLRIVVVRDPLAPVVTVELNYAVGSAESPSGFPGMAHAQEHMMFRGSSQLSAAQLAAITAQMGGDYDADTQPTVTQYFMTVPAEDLGVALHIEAARMHDVIDAQDAWNEERGPIEQEVSADDSNPVSKAFITLQSDLFVGTPYTVNGVGTRASFDKTTGSMLRDFYRHWYGPNNAVLVIAGDVDPSAAIEQVKSPFSSIPRRATPARAPIALGPPKAAALTSDTDLPVPIVVVGYRMPGSDSPDYPAALVLSGVLSSQRADLYALVPQGQAFQTFFFNNGLPGAGEGIAAAALKPGVDPTAEVGTIENIIAGYVRNGVPADLVHAAQRQALAQEESQFDSISGLASAWSQAIAIEGRSDPADDIKAMQRVTLADVNRIARTYLINATAVTAVLTPKPSGRPSSSQTFGSPESFAPKDTKAVALPSWATAAFGTLSIPTSTLAPVATTLPNGLRLIIQTETVSRTVTVSGSVKAEPALQEPMGKEGVSSVVDDLFSYGSTHLSRVEYARALDDIAASENGGSSFGVSVLAANFDRGVQLLADNELHPVFEASDFAAVQQKEAQAAASELQSPGYLQDRALALGLYPKNDPALRQPTLASVSGLSLADAQSYYEHVFRPDTTTIVVIGDVTPAKARAAVEKWFGAWRASGPAPKTDLPKVALNRPSMTVVPDASRVQDNVTLRENLSITRSNPDYYALQVGDHVLGGAFYATRLYHDVREKAGLAYFVGNDLSVGSTRSTYSVDYGCDPPNVSKTKSIILRDLRRMQTAPVTPAELEQAKALLLREIPLSESDEDSIAGALMARSQRGLPLDEPERAARIYLGITAAQVQAAFAKWIRPDAFVEAVQGPTPH